MRRKTVGEHGTVPSRKLCINAVCPTVCVVRHCINRPR
jgi:hypothetical protein